jgi:hypothetical protein
MGDTQREMAGVQAAALAAALVIIAAGTLAGRSRRAAGRPPV